MILSVYSLLSKLKLWFENRSFCNTSPINFVISYLVSVSVITAASLAIFGGLAWLALWYFKGNPLVAIIMPSLVLGFLFSTILFCFTPFGKWNACKIYKCMYMWLVHVNRILPKEIVLSLKENILNNNRDGVCYIQHIRHTLY